MNDKLEDKVSERVLQTYLDKFDWDLDLLLLSSIRTRLTKEAIRTLLRCLG